MGAHDISTLSHFIAQVPFLLLNSVTQSGLSFSRNRKPTTPWTKSEDNKLMIFSYFSQKMGFSIS